jgi:alpha-D-xyloside xylohydrolase
MGRRIVSAAVAAAALSLCYGAPTGNGSTGPVAAWTVRSAPFLLTFAGPADEVVGESSDTGGLGYVTSDGTRHGLGRLLATQYLSRGERYTVATDEPTRTAVVDVRREGHGIEVSLGLQPATGVSATLERFTAGPKEHFLGGGERYGALDLRGQALAIKTSYSCGNSMPAPFYLSSAGYGIALESTAIASLGFPGANPTTVCAGGSEPMCPLTIAQDQVQLCLKTPQLAYRIFFGNPERVVSAYTALAGRPLVPQPTEFELIKWRDVVGGTADLYQDVEEFHRLGIPIGWVLLDNPWESGLCYGTMSFDSGRFPDPAGMIETLHTAGVRLMVWVSPLVRRQWCPPPDGYASSALLANGSNAFTLDLTDPAAYSMLESRLRSLLTLGVDGFKADRGDEFDFEGRPVAGGAGAALQNTYPLLFARAVAQAVQAAGRSASFPTIFRVAAPGSASTVSGFWGGDQEGSFGGLRQAIHAGLSAGLAGYSTWGSDTGGYSSDGLTSEVFVRWAQFSAVSPVFEVGGSGGNSTPWDFGIRTVAELRDAVVLHYELFPYLYGLARAAHTRGLPVLRPLALAYPREAGAWSHDLEALVGPDLLAAPVTEPGTLANVYLPAGAWVDLATGRTMRGPESLSRPTPLERLPLYLRTGSAIPFAARTPAIWPKPWPVNATTMAGRGGWIVAPAAGRTRRSDPRFGRLSATEHGSTLDLRVARAPRETQVLVTGLPRPARVKIGGRLVERATSIASLRAARSGWTPVAEPFHGIVLKLAPNHGAADVRISFG